MSDYLVAACHSVIMRILAVVLLCLVIATSALSVVGHIGLAAGWWR